MGSVLAQVRQLVLTAMEQCASAAAQSYHAVAGDAGITAGTTGGFSLAVPHHVEVLGQKLIQAVADVCIKVRRDDPSCWYSIHGYPTALDIEGRQCYT